MKITNLISAMVNRKISVQIISRISVIFPSIISSGPMLVSLTPRDVINSRALFTFSAFCTLIRGFLLYLPREVSPVWNYSIRKVILVWIREFRSTHDFLSMLMSEEATFMSI